MSRSFAILQVLLFNKESILKGFGRCRLFSSCSCVLDDRSIPLSLVSVTDVANIELSPKVSDSAPESPTTSMSLSLSIASVPRCARYSRFKATRSTVIPGMMGNCALIEHFFLIGCSFLPLARSFRACLSRAFWSFFRRLALSLALSSAGGIGSPEQDWGWALWAGRPGPFFVCSFFLHLARRFWNHTWNQKTNVS